MVAARITAKGQITIPKVVRDQLDVKPGDALEFVVDAQAQRAELRPLRRRSIAEFRGAFKVNRPPDEPFDWSAQRSRAWESQAARLAPAREAEADNGVRSSDTQRGEVRG
jgi:antitoxin PrlF